MHLEGYFGFILGRRLFCYCRFFHQTHNKTVISSNSDPFRKSCGRISVFVTGVPRFDYISFAAAAAVLTDQGIDDSSVVPGIGFHGQGGVGIGEFLVPLTFFLQGSCDPDDGIGVQQGFFDGFVCHVCAVLADVGNNIVGDPTFELSGLRFAASEDESVQAREIGGMGLHCCVWAGTYIIMRTFYRSSLAISEIFCRKYFQTSI